MKPGSPENEPKEDIFLTKLQEFAQIFFLGFDGEEIAKRLVLSASAPPHMITFLDADQSTRVLIVGEWPLQCDGEGSYRGNWTEKEGSQRGDE